MMDLADECKHMGRDRVGYERRRLVVLNHKHRGVYSHVIGLH